MNVGDLFTICFGPSSGTTYIKITKKGYWVMGDLIFTINRFILKGN